MNALANALAHGQANAMRPTSVYAKRREGKGPHRTTPDHTTPDLKLSGSPSSFSSPDVPRDTATDMMPRRAS